MRNIQCELFNNTKTFSPIYHLGFNNSNLSQQLARFFLNCLSVHDIFSPYFFSARIFWGYLPNPSLKNLMVRSLPADVRNSDTLTIFKINFIVT